jgi:hypothetical protein
MKNIRLNIRQSHHLYWENIVEESNPYFRKNKFKKYKNTKVKRFFFIAPLVDFENLKRWIEINHA